MNTLITNDINNVIFIDGSYMIFYRYHALLSWQNHKTDKLTNEDFIEKYKKLFAEHLKKLPKNLKLNKSDKNLIIVGKDCQQSNIWRNEFIDGYKDGRPNCDEIKPFFEIAYDSLYTPENNISLILELDKLEADDCIALSAKHIELKYPHITNYIITSDKDYMQLMSANIKLFDLKFKELSCPTLSKTEYSHNSKAHLFVKILSGDNSDNISSVFKKCGPKTALKYFENTELFEKKLEDENAHDKYKINKHVIDFNEIPLFFVKQFVDKYSLF